MFSIIRSFTSLYWVIRDIFRPLFRTTFFWLILLSVAVWLILSGQAGAFSFSDYVNSTINSPYKFGPEEFPINSSSLSPLGYGFDYPSGTGIISNDYTLLNGYYAPGRLLNQPAAWNNYSSKLYIGGVVVSPKTLVNEIGYFYGSGNYDYINVPFNGIFSSFWWGEPIDYNGILPYWWGMTLYSLSSTEFKVKTYACGKEYDGYIFDWNGSNYFKAYDIKNSLVYVYDSVSSSSFFGSNFGGCNIPSILQKTPFQVYSYDLIIGHYNNFISDSNNISPFPNICISLEPYTCKGSIESWNVGTYPYINQSSMQLLQNKTPEFYSVDPVDPGTGGYEDLITEQDFKNYNMSMCIEKNLGMVNDFDLRTNLTACKIGSDSNVASGGTDIFLSMIAFYDQIANGSYTTNRIPWDTFDVYDSNVIQNCKDVHTSRNSLMLATRDPNIKPRNDQMLSAYNILDQMRPLYNTNETISHDYEQARSSCELSLNIIYELQKTEITDSCTGVGCIIENIMQQETPVVNSWLNPVGSWIAGIIAKIENIFTAIMGTNTVLDGVKNAINEKNMSFTGYTDIINNITGITVDIPDVVVDIPDVVVDIPDINIDLGYKEGTSTGGIFSFLNEYTTISTEYVFVPNMCKNTTPIDYDNRKNLIMLFMVTITTLSFYFIIIRR